MAGPETIKFGDAEIVHDGFYSAEEMEKVRAQIEDTTKNELENLKSDLIAWINTEVSNSNWRHLERPEAKEILDRLNVMLKNRYPDFDITKNNPMYTLSFILNKEHRKNVDIDTGRNFDVDLFRALTKYQSQNQTYKNTKLSVGDVGGRPDGVANGRTLKAFKTSFDGIDEIKENDKITPEQFSNFVSKNFGKGKTPDLGAVNKLIEYIVRNRSELRKGSNDNIKTIQAFLKTQENIQGIMVDKNGKVVFNKNDGKDVDNVGLSKILSQDGTLRDGVDGIAGERTLQALRVYKESLKKSKKEEVGKQREQIDENLLNKIINSRIRIKGELSELIIKGELISKLRDGTYEYNNGKQIIFFDEGGKYMKSKYKNNDNEYYDYYESTADTGEILLTPATPPAAPAEQAGQPEAQAGQQAPAEQAGQPEAQAGQQAAAEQAGQPEAQAGQPAVPPPATDTATDTVTPTPTPTPTPTIIINGNQITLEIFKTLNSEKKLEKIKKIKEDEKFKIAKPFLKAGLESDSEALKVEVIYKLAELQVSFGEALAFLILIDDEHFSDKWIDLIGNDQDGQERTKFKLNGKDVAWDKVRGWIKSEISK